jgi:hypothetical protein
MTPCWSAMLSCVRLRRLCATATAAPDSQIVAINGWNRLASTCAPRSATSVSAFHPAAAAVS